MRMVEPNRALCNPVARTSSYSCDKLCTATLFQGHLELLPLRSVRVRTGRRRAWSAVLLNAAAQAQQATGQVLRATTVSDLELLVSGVDQEVLVYHRTAGVNKWKRVGLVNTDTATLELVAGTQFYFLGNTPIVPADFVPFPTCEPGYFKNELKECQRCDAGKYTNEQDLAMCITCPMGNAKPLALHVTVV